jgi:Transposase DDE domain group 1/WD domain, G-beta repeat
VHELTGWARDLTVEVAGRGLVSHTGSVALRALADRTGLTAAVSSALARRGFEPVHDRGRVLADSTVMIADGGRVMSDLAVLRDQGELFGPVASDPTLWRTLHGVGDLQRDKLAAARARTRRHVWDRIVARHGAIPASVVADRDLGKTIVIRLDATLVVAHSDKELAAGTHKGSWGHHPLTAWCDNTGENRAVKLRTGSAGSNTVTDHLEVLTAAITGSLDETVRVWDLVAGAPVGPPLTGHAEAVSAVTCARLPDGRVVAVTGSWDETVRVWDLVAGAPVGPPLTGHTGPVAVVASRRLTDGRVVAVTGSHDATIRLWDLTGEIGIGAVQPLPNQISTLALDPSNTDLAVVLGTGRYLMRLDLSPGLLARPAR